MKTIRSRLPTAGRPDTNTSLHLLPEEVLLKITDQFPLGSKTPARLAQVDTRFAALLKKRTRADRLVHTAGTPDGDADPARFRVFMDRADTLDETGSTGGANKPVRDGEDKTLRHAVLHALSHRSRPYVGAANMGQILNRLCDALTAQDGTRQYALLHAMQNVFGKMPCVYSRTDAPLSNRLKADTEKVYRRFCNESDAVLADSRKTSDIVGSVAIHGTADTTDTGAGRLRAPGDTAELTSKILGMQARGLYMIIDSAERLAGWDRLHRDLRSGKADQRRELLHGLAQALCHLPEGQRSTRLEQILEETATLSKPGVARVTKGLLEAFPSLGDYDRSTAYAKLGQIRHATNAPPTIHGLLLDAESLDLCERPDRMMLLKRLVADATSLEPEQRSELLAKLSEKLFHFWPTAPRLQAFDIIRSAVGALPGEMREDPLVRLLDESCFFEDQPRNIWETRLTELVEMAAHTPVSEDGDLVYTLCVSAVKCYVYDRNGEYQIPPDSKVETLVDRMLVQIRRLPSEGQHQCLAAAYQVLGIDIGAEDQAVNEMELGGADNVPQPRQRFTDTQLFILGKLDAHARELPVEDGADLLQYSCLAAMEIDRLLPMANQFFSIAKDAYELPAPLQKQALFEIASNFKIARNREWPGPLSDGEIRALLSLQAVLPEVP